MRRLPIRLVTLAWFALALVWGSEWLLTSSLPPEPPVLSLSLRYAIASILLLPWAMRGRVWLLGTRALLQIAMVGAGLLALPQLLLAASAHGISPGWSLLALCGVPLLLAVGGYGEIPIAVGGFAGAVLLVANSLTMHPAQLPWLLLSCGRCSAPGLHPGALLGHATGIRGQLAERGFVPAAGSGGDADRGGGCNL
jgi:hypothetical protein